MVVSLNITEILQLRRNTEENKDKSWNYKAEIILGFIFQNKQRQFLLSLEIWLLRASQWLLKFEIF